MKNKGLKISSSQLEDFIWMSYRYCIGRHTIAASMHANTISKVLNENPDVLGKEKIDFMVKDIRTSILDIIRWYPNVKVTGSFDCSWDMYSKLLAVMSICPNPNNVIYTINLSEQTITWEESEKTFGSIDKFYHDIIPWVRLANLLDSNNYAEVTAKFNNKEHKIIC